LEHDKVVDSVTAMGAHTGRDEVDTVWMETRVTPAHGRREASEPRINRKSALFARGTGSSSELCRRATHIQPVRGTPAVERRPTVPVAIEGPNSAGTRSDEPSSDVVTNVVIVLGLAAAAGIVSVAIWG
jgi:hypothetical protein